MADSDSRSVKSAARALDILEHLSHSVPLSFPELVEALSLPRSSAHGLLKTLEAADWIAFDPDSRKYSLGLMAWQVGQQYDGNNRILESAPTLMAKLTAYTGETVQLARLDGVENVYIAITPSPNPMRLASNVGMRLHAHATGIGKALLSTLSDGEVDTRLRSVALPRLTPKTATSVDDILVAIRNGRDYGYFIDDEEFIEGCRCVAMSVTTPEETGISTAMSITMPTSRTDERWPQSMYEPLRSTVATLRKSLGLPATLDHSAVNAQKLAP